MPWACTFSIHQSKTSSQAYWSWLRSTLQLATADWLINKSTCIRNNYSSLFADQSVRNRCSRTQPLSLFCESLYDLCVMPWISQLRYLTSPWYRRWWKAHQLSQAFIAHRSSLPKNTFTDDITNKPCYCILTWRAAVLWHGMLLYFDMVCYCTLTWQGTVFWQGMVLYFDTECYCVLTWHGTVFWHCMLLYSLTIRCGNDCICSVSCRLVHPWSLRASWLCFHLHP